MNKAPRALWGNGAPMEPFTRRHEGDSSPTRKTTPDTYKKEKRDWLVASLQQHARPGGLQVPGEERKGAWPGLQLRMLSRKKSELAGLVETYSLLSAS